MCNNDIETFGTMDRLAPGLIHGLMFVSWTIHASLSFSDPFLSTRLVSAHDLVPLPRQLPLLVAAASFHVLLIHE
jgi:hypothetical protein